MRWHDSTIWPYDPDHRERVNRDIADGVRARVYAGKDPITGKQTYLRGQTRRDRRDAEADAERLFAHVDADRLPDRHATPVVL